MIRKALSLLLLIPSIAGAASQGPLFSTSCTNDASFGTNVWVNVGNACAEDGSVATESGSSQYIKAVSLGFTLPSNATVTGIQFDVKKQATSGQLVLDASVRLYINGVASGNNKSIGTDWIDTGLTYVTYGGAGDTWGIAGLLGSDINNANFGLAFACQKDGTGTQTANVDAIRATIFYTAAATPTQINGGTIYNGTLR